MRRSCSVSKNTGVPPASACIRTGVDANTDSRAESANLKTTGILDGRAASPRTPSQSRNPRRILSPTLSRRSATSELNRAAVSSSARPKSRSPPSRSHEGTHARARWRSSAEKSDARRRSSLGGRGSFTAVLPLENKKGTPGCRSDSSDAHDTRFGQATCPP